MLLNSLRSSGPQNGCPACVGEGNTVQFDWKWAQENPQSDWGRTVQCLVRREKLRSGFLFQCANCRQYWYLDETKEKMSFIPKDRVSLLETWGKTDLLLTPELFQKALAIGATPPHISARQSQYAEIPCRVLTHENKWIDKCLLIFTNAAPIDPDFGNARLLDEVKDIEPSDYALSPAIRLATSRSQPDGTGKALTKVETTKGKTLLLNWTVNFVDRKETRGASLELVQASHEPSTKKRSNKLPVLQEPMETITILMGDWSSNIRELLIPE